MPSWKKLLTSGSDISVNNLNTEGIRFFGGSVQLAITGSGGQGGSLGIGDLPHNNSYTKLTLQAAQTHSIVLDSGDIKLDGIHNQASEATSLMINGSGVVGTRELGSNAFTSTTIGQNTNNLSVDNSTLAFNSGTTYNGSAARTISIKADGVGSAQIADDAINSEHYTDGSIDTAHIADLQITTAKIAADAITGAKIADDVVDSEHIAAGAIDTEHIAAEQVTYAKIQNVSATDRILGRDSSGAGVIEEISPSALRTMINVEDGATADQTQADINGLAITEVGTISSGVWNGTAIASAYLDADTAHLSGTQTFSGAKTFSSTATFTNAIQLNDSDIIYLGTGQDFEIYHDGSNAYFRGKKHGGLAYFQLENSAGTNQNAIILGESGSAAKVGVELRYNNVGRIWTTNDGSVISSPTLIGLSGQSSEATALMINGSNVVGTRELGSNAFTSTTIGTTTNNLTVDNSTLALNSGTTFNGSAARTISIKADGVGSAQIADNAINSEHYTDGSIDTAHIADLQVTTAKIAADAIDGTKLADDAVDSEHITDGSVDNVHLAGSIANAKLSNSTISGVSLGSNLNSLSAASKGGITLTSYNGSAAVSDLALDIDGMDDIGEALVDADLMIVDNGAGGTNRKATMSRLKTYMQSNLTFTTNTDTVDMGDGFVVTADTNSNATTITEGETLTIAGGTNVTTETTADGTVTITATDTNTQLSTADVRGKFSAGDGIGISSGEISLDLDGMDDIGEALVDADLIAVDNGAGGTNRKATMSRLATYMQSALTFTTNTDTFRTVEVDTNGNGSANNTLTASETLRFKKGSNITLSESGGVITIASTDTNTQNSRADLGIDTGDDVVFGSVKADDTTASTSTTTGALRSDGGLGVAGAIYAGDDIVAFYSSDKRLKDNIKPIENPLDKISKISGNTFVWNDNHEVYNGTKDVGVIAQEIEEVLPELVTTRDNGYKAVKYDKIVALLIESIKELKEEVEDLKKQIK